MAYKITRTCINCDRCRSVCPTGAIGIVEGKPFIDPELCNNCIGYYGTAQCKTVCLADRGCVLSLIDYWDVWFDRYENLIARLENRENRRYWEKWFHLYSEKVQRLQTASVNP